MRGLATLVVLAAFTSPTQHPVPVHCTAQAFRPFSAKVWDISRWQRAETTDATIRAERRRLSCAPADHRHAMKHIWRRDQRAFYDHRKRKLWRVRVTPFYYGGHYWAVPYPIALCESGGDYFVGPSGAYGLIPPFPQWLSPREQDRIAHRLYLEQGEGPWAPYESGCAYR